MGSGNPFSRKISVINYINNGIPLSTSYAHAPITGFIHKTTYMNSKGPSSEH